LFKVLVEGRYGAVRVKGIGVWWFIKVSLSGAEESGVM